MEEEAFTSVIFHLYKLMVKSPYNFYFTNNCLCIKYPQNVHFLDAWSPKSDTLGFSSRKGSICLNLFLTDAAGT